ncbi:MAG TPA: lysophospholipid acyltransferase family protein, partial [Candidatus Nitrosopolaris sp.]|nr:lysophospholipid acyltransferase family protein [Candidatus Nitrosopolaris sp.]
DAPAALTAIRELGERVRLGRASAVIFPEGTRARVGQLGPFRPAGTRALLESAPDTPLVSVTVDESWRLLARNMLPVPWGVHVRVRIGEPIARHSGEDQEALIEQVREEIASTLARWRGEDRVAVDDSALRRGTA